MLRGERAAARGHGAARAFYPRAVLSRRRRFACALVGALGLTVLVPAAPVAAAPRVALDPIASITGATATAVRAGDTTRYVTLQRGLVVALRPGAEPETVLDLRSRVQTGYEQGLLGLVFAPDGERLYLHYSGRPSGETVLEEYAVADGRIDPETRRVLLTVRQPQANHNGGQLAFGPDGFLYVGLGDGGNGNDVGPGHAPEGNGQSPSTLLGKILRIDPRRSGNAPYTVPADNPFADGGGRPEIYVTGLRNPWRFSFDRKTGDLWVADVGQGEYEEATRLTPEEAPGANLGWNLFEGRHPGRDGPDTDVVMPQIETSHDDGNCSITGGYVYRGTAIRALRGWYLYSDFCNGTIKAAKIAASGDLRTRDLGIELSQVSSFGEDADGELTVLSLDQGVFRLVKG
jgi:glucose/arabinose dehydrogenase